MGFFSFLLFTVKIKMYKFAYEKDNYKRNR